MSKELVWVETAGGFVSNDYKVVWWHNYGFCCRATWMGIQIGKNGYDQPDLAKKVCQLHHEALLLAIAEVEGAKP